MASETSTSIFSYNLSRPFPYPWLTWVVLVSGMILTVLFSFVAVASNAYELDSIYTTDPNATERQQGWYSKQPFSWFSSLEAECQPSLLTVGGSYKTSNGGLLYSLSGLRNESGFIPSTAYKNAPLQGCDVSEMSIVFARADATRLPMNYWTWGDTSTAALIACSANSSSGPLQFNFTVTLPIAGAGAQDRIVTISNLVSSLQRQTALGYTNLWYGMQLTAKWYRTLPRAIGYSTPHSDGDESWATGSVWLRRNSNTSDFTQQSFFFAGPSFSTDQGGLMWMNDSHTMADWASDWASPTDGPAFGMPNISITVDAFAKSFYSLLLTDFGAHNDANALNSIVGFQYLKKINDTELADASETLGKPASGTIGQNFGPASGEDQSFSAPNTTTTTIFTQYLCSKPRKKSGMSLLIPVLIADLVFLQTCWTIFKFVMSWWVVRKDSTMNYCVGCAAAEKARAAGAKESASRPATLRSHSGYQASEAQELLSLNRVDDGNGVYLR